jgi:IclR family transcriptional regulator, acetate operon repressor
MATAGRNGIQVIARAAAVLRALAGNPEGLSLAQIAQRVDLPRSTVQRIVAALSREQLLMPASSNARVLLGPALAQLASSVSVGVDKIARPHMHELALLTDETVDLSLLRRGSAVFLEQIPGTQRLIAQSAVGKEFPLHCTANGKAMLALIPAAERSSLLPARLARYTEATITEGNALEAELTGISRAGVAYDHEEHHAGISAVGAAFKDASGHVYALSIPVPTARFDGKRKLLVKLLKEATARLVSELGLPIASS